MKRVVLVMLLAFSSGCADNATVSPEGAWGDDAWTLEPVVRIGSVDGDGATSFGRIVSITMDDEENLYVLDGQAAEVRMFDRSGEYVRTIGGRGEGPGELSSPHAVALDEEGRLWVADRGNRRYTVFDRAGRVIRSLPSPLQGVVARGQLRVEGGSVYDFGALQRREESDGGLRIEGLGPGLVRFEVGEELVATDTIPMGMHTVPGFRGSSGGTSFTMRPPFAAEQVFDVGPGGRLWVGISDEYVIQLLASHQDTVHAVSRPVDRPRFDPGSARDLQEWADAVTEQGFEGDMALLPEGYPFFNRLVASDDGFLWVYRQIGEDGWFFDVFDDQGQHLGMVPTEIAANGAGVHPHISATHVAGVTMDSLDVQYVSVFRIERP